MGIIFDKESYKKLINDDAKWLVENAPKSLEREHILKVLWDSIDKNYPPEDVADKINVSDQGEISIPSPDPWSGLFNG